MPSAHTVQDNYNDSHSLASDASEGEAHSRTSYISQDHDPEVETIQDNDNDSDSSASDASESEAHSRISRDHDPEVENLMSHSPRRRRKTRRRTMGMERPEYINKGASILLSHGRPSHEELRE